MAGLRQNRNLLIAALTAAAASVCVAADADPPAATDTRAWVNCRGGKGIWTDLRITGCSEAMKSATGENLATAHYLRGNAWLAKSEYRKAVEDFSRSLQLAPGNPDALHERCWARAVLGKALDEALSDCNEALRLRPNDPETLGGRGYVYLRLGFFRTAIRDYDAALAAMPETPDFLYARGTARIEVGEEEGGQADIIAARALDPEVADRFERYAQAGSTGVWASMMDYWRAALRWIY